MQRPTLKALLVAVLALAIASPAAASPLDVIRDCSEDGSIDRRYSQNELRGALDQLPSDLDEYTDCRSVIRAAQLSGAGGKGAKQSRRSVAGLVDPNQPPTELEQRELAQAAGQDAPVEIGGRTVRPGGTGVGFATSGLGGSLPDSLLVVLVLLGLAMLAGTGLALQRRWPDAWRTATGPVSAGVRRVREGVRRGISRRR